MEEESRKTAGWLVIVLSTVIYGGVSLLQMIVSKDTGYVNNPLRQDLFRAGHAHAGVLLILSLVILLYVDRTSYGPKAKRFIRHSIPLSAILLPAGFFFSVLDPQATEPNAFIYAAYAGAVLLVAGLIMLGIGLIKNKNSSIN